MRNLFLAAALVLGLGVATTGAQAAAVSGNVTAVDAVAKSGNPVVEKTHYRRYYHRHRYWRRPYWRHRYYRRHYWRPYYGYRYGYRHRYWHHRRHYY